MANQTSGVTVGSAPNVTNVGGNQFRPSVNYSTPVMQPIQRQSVKVENDDGFSVRDIFSGVKDIANTYINMKEKEADRAEKAEERAAKRAKEEAEAAEKAAINDYAKQVNAINVARNNGHLTQEAAENRIRALSDDYMSRGFDQSKLKGARENWDGGITSLTDKLYDNIAAREQKQEFDEIDAFKTTYKVNWGDTKVKSYLDQSKYMKAQLDVLTRAMNTSDPETRKSLFESSINSITDPLTKQMAVKYQQLVNDPRYIDNAGQATHEFFEVAKAEMKNHLRGQGFLPEEMDIIVGETLKNIGYTREMEMRDEAIVSNTKAVKDATDFIIEDRRGQLIKGIPGLATMASVKNVLPDSVFQTLGNDVLGGIGNLVSNLVASEGAPTNRLGIPSDGSSTAFSVNKMEGQGAIPNGLQASTAAYQGFLQRGYDAPWRSAAAKVMANQYVAEAEQNLPPREMEIAIKNGDYILDILDREQDAGVRQGPADAVKSSQEALKLKQNPEIDSAINTLNSGFQTEQLRVDNRTGQLVYTDNGRGKLAGIGFATDGTDTLQLIEQVNHALPPTQTPEKNAAVLSKAFGRNIPVLGKNEKAITMKDTSLWNIPANLLRGYISTQNELLGKVMNGNFSQEDAAKLVDNVKGFLGHFGWNGNSDLQNAINSVDKQKGIDNTTELPQGYGKIDTEYGQLPYNTNQVSTDPTMVMVETPDGVKSYPNPKADVVTESVEYPKDAQGNIVDPFTGAIVVPAERTSTSTIKGSSTVSFPMMMFNEEFKSEEEMNKAFDKAEQKESDKFDRGEISSEQYAKNIDMLEAGREKGKEAFNEEKIKNDLVEQGNIDLENRPIVYNKDGSYSIVRSMTAGFDGIYYNIPTVIGDKVVSDEDAIQHFLDTGEHLGAYKTKEAATMAAEKLHQDQSRMYSDKANIGRYGDKDNGSKVAGMSFASIEKTNTNVENKKELQKRLESLLITPKVSERNGKQNIADSVDKLKSSSKENYKQYLKDLGYDSKLYDKGAERTSFVNKLIDKNYDKLDWVKQYVTKEDLKKWIAHESGYRADALNTGTDSGYLVNSFGLTQIRPSAFVSSGYTGDILNPEDSFEASVIYLKKIADIIKKDINSKNKKGEYTHTTLRKNVLNKNGEFDSESFKKALFNGYNKGESSFTSGVKTNENIVNNNYYKSIKNQTLESFE